MIFAPRYHVRHRLRADGSLVTEILDRRRRTCSRLNGCFRTEDIIHWLGLMRRACRARNGRDE